MTTIAHLSDTHFGTEIPEVVEAAVRSIHEIAPDIVILSGDITQRARKEQFLAAAAFMDRLPARTKIIIPGNHDIPLFNVAARFLTPYRNYRSAFGARESVWREGRLGIIGFDATSPFRHVDGKLDKKQIQRRVAQARAQLPEDAFLIVCAHQPLFTAWKEDASETLIGREETARLFSQCGIDLVLSGHVHVPLMADTREAFPHLPRHFLLCGAGTAISHRTRPGAPNSFNVIRFSEAVEIVKYDYDQPSSAFIRNSHRMFQREAGGWKLHPS